MENNWLKDEAERIKTPDLSNVEDLIIEEGEITLSVDFSNKFQKWEDAEKGTVKSIIPVTVDGKKYVWWLNNNNPIYSQLIKKGLEGQTTFKITRTGLGIDSRYSLE